MVGGLGFRATAVYFSVEFSYFLMGGAAASP